jgi:hypothetical protein
MQIHKQAELERSQKASNPIQLLMHLTYKRCMWYGFLFPMLGSDGRCPCHQRLSGETSWCCISSSAASSGRFFFTPISDSTVPILSIWVRIHGFESQPNTSASLFALCLLFWVLYFGRCSHRPGQFPKCAVEAGALRMALPRAQWLVELAVHALSGQSTHRGRRAKSPAKSIVQSYLVWIFHLADDWARRRRPAGAAGAAWVALLPTAVRFHKCRSAIGLSDQILPTAGAKNTVSS